MEIISEEMEEGRKNRKHPSPPVVLTVLLPDKIHKIKKANGENEYHFSICLFSRSISKLENRKIFSRKSRFFTAILFSALFYFLFVECLIYGGKKRRLQVLPQQAATANHHSQ